MRKRGGEEKEEKEVVDTERWCEEEKVRCNSLAVFLVPLTHINNLCDVVVGTQIQ